MFKTIVILLCLNIFLVDCVAYVKTKSSKVDSSRNIVGGYEVQPDHKYKHQVSIRTSGRHSCGGSIISRRMILTAAHCLNSATLRYYSVVAGLTNKTHHGTPIPIKRKVYHENYDSRMITSDIGIIITQKKIDFNSKVGKIDIYDEHFKAEQVCEVTGWGRLKYNGASPDNLQKITQKSVSNLACNKAHNPYRIDETTQICVSAGKGKGLCQGDSGGPLTFNEQLVGIVSWGRNCAMGYPDVLTRVKAFQSWIDNVDDHKDDDTYWENSRYST